MKRIACLLVVSLLNACSGGGGGGGGDATNGSSPLVHMASATSIGLIGATLIGK